MTAPANSAGFYADFSGMSALKKSAREQDPKALREAARQFESVFTNMMLKSMRSASLGSSLGESDQSNFYREMFDNQLAVQMSKGRGLGLAEMLVKQLQQPDAAAATAHPTLLPATPPLPARNSAAGVTASTTTLTASARTDSSNSFDEIAHYLGITATSDDAATSTDATPSTVSTKVNPVAGKNDVSSTSSVQQLAANAVDFVRQLWPHAKAAARELGVDPGTLIAHAALETGWGRAVPCDGNGNCSFNLFGIKAGNSWQGSAVNSRTQEYESGIAVEKREKFRAYDSTAESFRDYATLLKSNPRYAAALGTGKDAGAFANALQQGGYATDPSYAAKLSAVAAKVANWLPHSGLNNSGLNNSRLKGAGLKLSTLSPISSRGNAI